MKFHKITILVAFIATFLFPGCSEVETPVATRMFSFTITPSGGSSTTLAGTAEFEIIDAGGSVKFLDVELDNPSSSNTQRVALEFINPNNTNTNTVLANRSYFPVGSIPINTNQVFIVLQLDNETYVAAAGNGTVNIFSSSSSKFTGELNGVVMEDVNLLLPALTINGQFDAGLK